MEAIIIRAEEEEEEEEEDEVVVEEAGWDSVHATAFLHERDYIHVHVSCLHRYSDSCMICRLYRSVQ